MIAACRVGQRVPGAAWRAGERHGEWERERECVQGVAKNDDAMSSY